ncbi:MAG: phosphatase PAP2 family protein [bacterium]
MFEHVNGLAGHAAWLDGLLTFFTRYGPYVFIAAFVVAWFWPGSPARRERWQIAAIIAAVGVLLALGLNQVIIHLWARPRPFVGHPALLLVSASHDSSFPSDHSTFVFAAAIGLLMANRRIGMAALVLAALVAFSRVYVGAHYATDVAAGAAIGCAAVLIVHSQRGHIARVAEPVLRRARRVHLA